MTDTVNQNLPDELEITMSTRNSSMENGYWFRTAFKNASQCTLGEDHHTCDPYSSMILKTAFGNDSVASAKVLNGKVMEARDYRGLDVLSSNRWMQKLDVVMCVKYEMATFYQRVDSSIISFIDIFAQETSTTQRIYLLRNKMMDHFHVYTIMRSQKALKFQLFLEEELVMGFMNIGQIIVKLMQD